MSENATAPGVYVSKRSNGHLKISPGVICMLTLVRASCVFVVTAAFLSTGCGEEHTTHPVRGKVTFKDGTPVKMGTVVFSTKESRRSSKGIIAEDGSFQLTSYEPNDGAEVGPHVVTVTANPDVDPKYGNYDTSKIEVEVKEGENDFKIEVE